MGAVSRAFCTLIESLARTNEGQQNNKRGTCQSCQLQKVRDPSRLELETPTEL